MKTKVMTTIVEGIVANLNAAETSFADRAKQYRQKEEHARNAMINASWRASDYRLIAREAFERGDIQEGFRCEKKAEQQVEQYERHKEMFLTYVLINGHDITF